MSELTPCNYCTLKHIEQRAKRNGNQVILKNSLDGVNVYVIPKGQELSPDTEITAWFMELSDHCCC